MKKYTEYKNLNLTEISKNILQFWEKNNIFKKSIESRKKGKNFVFFEGPPSANGLPGIHHVMGRTIKDVFCRFQTQLGKKVDRKAGWDTHGLPVELGVEKELNITKEDIGIKISIEDYNKACKNAVMKYTSIWNDLTKKMGYWVDMENPYISYETKYIESVWWLLKKIYSKNLLYKGYSIQPYSPKAGTGISSHELNMPGTYKDVKDVTIVAQFKAIENKQLHQLFGKLNSSLYFLAWTTTPWTLPSNTALSVGKKIEYALVETFNQYSNKRIFVILAKDLISKQFNKKYIETNNIEELNTYSNQNKNTPYLIHKVVTGENLLGLKYEQLLPYCQPHEKSNLTYSIISGEFVTTEDGTGIVHIAPTFGTDDAFVAKKAGIPPMTILDKTDKSIPLVDLQGRFIKEVIDPVFGLSGEYVKAEYLSEKEKKIELSIQREKLKKYIPDLKKYLSVDERITLKLKLEEKAFKIEKYTHSYPHCWRTDKPILYYPLDSWFVKTTAKKNQLINLNKEINWYPKSTGEGRFENWLKNLNDWNLSRSRYWGIPLPVWKDADGKETKCIGSLKELKEACEESVKTGNMKNNPLENFAIDNMSDENYNNIDVHKPFIDNIILTSSKGKPMKRESDIIDVWFDSGSVPYAQWHYPFENKEKIESNLSYPADFIAEGVDQTRGWFFTLHTISALCFNKISFKNVISNGLVLDKEGRKMSKRLGNSVDPFHALEKYSPDVIRWYMITNTQPWDNLKFDIEGIIEIQKKFFRALHNTYNFFSLYANIDNFKYEFADIEERPEIDNWILSKLNSLIKSVFYDLNNFDATNAGRQIQIFVVDDLSNWYVRLCRKRFWKGEYTEDKISAYQTLYTCLKSISQLIAPIAPFYAEQLFLDLNAVTNKNNQESVHLSYFPKSNELLINLELEEKMELAQKISSMVLSLRKKENIRVRQPIQKIIIPIIQKKTIELPKSITNLIKIETNVKKIEFLTDTEQFLVKRVKPNFKTLGPKYGQYMKSIASVIQKWTQNEIKDLEINQIKKIDIDNKTIELNLNDVEIITDDIPGWIVLSDGGITVAIDIIITEKLELEGLARELINKIQNLRKKSLFNITDRIKINIEYQNKIEKCVKQFFDYICMETLTDDIIFVEYLPEFTEVELINDIKLNILIKKI